MNREQFIAQLARLLQDLPPAERQEAIRYYQEYFDDAGEENEDAVIQELGSPGKVAASIKANLQYGGSTFGANDTDMENTGTESQTKDADGWQQNGQTMNRWNQSTQQGWQNSSTQSPYAMAFDECPSSVAERSYVEDSVARTTRWLARCKTEMARLNSLEDTINKNQLMFGINQGAIFDDIRIDHAKAISEMNLDGYAVGGLAVGESHEEMYHILDVTVPHLPLEKPTYLMGVGTPANILEAVDRGVDFFDCVYPSRNGRHGHVYTNQGKRNLFNAKYELDQRPIEEGCQCPACRNYSRGYIRHLLKAKEMLGMRLCVLHNLYFYNTMMSEIRQAIEEGRYKEYKKQKLEGFLENDKK